MKRESLTNLFWVIFVLAIFFVLFLASQYNYLLFHAFAEMSSIGVAIAVFTIGWNTRHSDNEFYYIIGVAYLFIGGIDLLHTLAYSGMNIFIGFDADLPTQLWIFARFLETFTILFLSSVVLRRKINYKYIMPVYFLITILVLPTIFVWNIFPSCFVEGTGLTLFKVLSEYVIVGILLVSIFLFHKHKDQLHPRVYTLLIRAIILTIFAELAFTLYTDVYGLSNLIGHFLKILSFTIIYLAIVQVSIQQPHETLFRKLKNQEQALIEINDTLRLTGRIVGHDVGNQLMVVRTILELLEDSPERIELAKDAIMKSGHLIRDMQTMSDHAVVGIPLTPFSMRNVVIAVKTDSSININIEGECVVLADMALTSVVYNLIRNAELHSGTENIDVKIQKRDDQCFTQIIDYGTGVHESIRGTLFEKDVKHGKTSGSGIGLFITKRILNRYGGDISYEPNIPTGSIFTITMKCA